MSMVRFIDTYNSIVGSIAIVLSAIFGKCWFLFALFLMFNVIDWLTGWYKARQLNKESSKIGLNGLLKKLGYWAIIIVAFSISLSAIEIGKIIGIDLSFLICFGWFILASLMINEARSILENLVETGYNVPPLLVKGLAVYEKMLQNNIPFKDLTDDDKIRTNKRE